MYTRLKIRRWRSIDPSKSWLWACKQVLIGKEITRDHLFKASCRRRAAKSNNSDFFVSAELQFNDQPPSLPSAGAPSVQLSQPPSQTGNSTELFDNHHNNSNNNTHINFEDICIDSQPQPQSSRVTVQVLMSGQYSASLPNADPILIQEEII